MATLRQFASLPKRDVNSNGGIAPDDDNVVVLEDDNEIATDPKADAVHVELPDGSVTINLGGILPDRDAEPSGFYSNLAEEIPETVLSMIAEDLLEGIEEDERSRQEWLDIRAAGLELLGLKIEDSKTDTSTTSAPLEGMSCVRHPLLLESVLRFQANASGELLPTDGPVKIRVDDVSTDQPSNAGQLPAGQAGVAAPVEQVPPQGQDQGAPSGANGVAPTAVPNGLPGQQQDSVAVQPPQGEPPNENRDAEYLETDFNHYLTTIASEYYPDTDRMLFFVGFGGTGFKKVYNCPLRRRPVSESVDAKDLIVSNTTTDLKNAGRVTHKIEMRPSVVKRMQLVGAYRDISLVEMSNQEPDPVTLKVHDIQGTESQSQMRPKEIDRVIYECYCEYDIPGYEHKGKNKKPTGLPLPYKVTIDKESRRVLEVRRNWKEGEDEFPVAKEYFVKWPFVQGLGFYDIGLLHILGNTTVALTAGWREGLDAGMFANFPGFLFAKGGARQNTNEFRVPPGAGVPIDVTGEDIRRSVMPLPYKEMGAGMMQLLDNIGQTGQRVGGTAEINVGEGKQDAPVGTTIALIEQAAKVMDAVHKRLYQAQSKEFQLLRDRFREDPESFWRFNKKPATQWDKDRFIRCLDNNDLVPAADPNTASHMARIMRAQAVYMMAMQSPQVMDLKKAIEEALYTIKVQDPDSYFAPPQQGPAPGDLQAQADMMKAQAQIASSQAGVQKAALDIKRTQIIHQKEIMDMNVDNARQAQELQMNVQDMQQRHALDAAKFKGDMYNKHADRQQNQQQFMVDKQLEAQKMAQEAQRNQADIAMKAQDQQLHAQDQQFQHQTGIHDRMVDHQMQQQDRQDAMEDKAFERANAERDRQDAAKQRDADMKDRDKERKVKKDIATIGAKAKAKAATKKPDSTKK